MKNINAARATVAWMREHPEQVDPNSWIAESKCGTRACFAGHHALLHGCQIDSTQYTADYVTTPSGDVMHAAVFTRDHLALTDDERMALFYRWNTQAELEQVLDRIVDGDLDA